MKQNLFHRVMRKVLIGDAPIPQKAPSIPFAAITDERRAEPVPRDNPIDSYQRAPYFYISVKRIADAIASLPVSVMRVRGDDMMPEKGDAQRLIDSPNAWEGSYAWRRGLASWLKITGESFTMLEDGSPDSAAQSMRPPHEMYNLPSDRERIRIIPHPVKRIDHYEYYVNSKWRSIPPHKIMHISEFSPASDLSGTGAGDVLQTIFALEKFADAWNVEGFRKGGSHMRAVIETEKAMQPAQRRQFAEWFTRVLLGVRRWTEDSRNNTHKPIIASDGFKVKPFGQTMQDMEFSEMRRYNREVMTGACGIGPARGGILENANYSNMVEQDRIFWESEIQPLLRLIEGVISRILLPRFGSDLRLVHDLSGVSALQENMGDWVEWCERLMRTKAMTPNEARQILTMKGFPGVAKDLPKGNAVIPDYYGISFTPQAGSDDLLLPEGPFELADGKLMEKGPSAKDWFEDSIESMRATQYREKTKAQDAEAADKLGRKFIPDLRHLLDEWEQNILDGLKKREKAFGKQYTVSDIDTIITDTAEGARDVAADRAMRFHTAAIKTRADQILRQLGIDETLDVLSPHVQAYLRRKVQVFADRWPRTVLERLRGTLVEGVNAGESVQEMSERVLDVMRGGKLLRRAGRLGGERARALTIARTEATPAYNFGAIAAYDQSGVVEYKEWLTSEDDAVRDMHRSVNGKKVPIHEPFEVGPDRLQYPGEPGGHPSNIINCRCTMIPVINEGKRAARIAAKGNGCRSRAKESVGSTSSSDA